jgi:amino acid transporter
MSERPEDRRIADDVQTLQRLGYQQELHRGMSGFSNFAISLSIICILAGGITSFHLGLGSVGGASIGLGWPLCCLFSLIVALTMGQVASAFPTAGGLYHWAVLLGGRGWGWATAWFNLAGLLAVLAAINVGTYQFTRDSLGPYLGLQPGKWSDARNLVIQTLVVALLTFSQAVFNHRGIRLTTRLTDFSGYWILFVSVALTVALLIGVRQFEPERLTTFSNFSGLPLPPEGEPAQPIWPRTEHVAWLFLLGMLLPAYTLTGFDASAHTAEETIGAAREVPRGIVRSVLVSGVFGWVMLSAAVLAAPDLRAAVDQKEGAFPWIVEQATPPWLAVTLFVGIVLAQYLCGLATVTSASRMVYAFARDGGLPGSSWLRIVSPTFLSPVNAVWTVAVLSVAFTLWSPVYSTITAVAVIFLYISYVLPTALGLFAYRRTWTRMGPWDLGRWYRPLAVLCVLGCGLLFVIGVQPPNELALPTVACTVGLMLLLWYGVERRRFRGPPRTLTDSESAERAGFDGGGKPT